MQRLHSHKVQLIHINQGMRVNRILLACRHAPLPSDPMRTQRLRRLAVHVLLSWLFVLGTGFANACVIQEQLRQSAHSATHGDEAAGDHTTIDCQTGHDHTSHAGNPPCEQFKIDRSALPQTAKQQSHSSSDFWPASAPLPSFVFLVMPEAPERVKSKPGSVSATIPIPIAFLRLTL
jgi:hypothetical protein